MNDSLSSTTFPELTASDLLARQLVVSYFQTIESKRIFCILDLEYNILAINDLTMSIFQLYGDNFLGKNFLHDFNRSPYRFTFAKANLLNCSLNKRKIQFLSVNKIRKIDYELLLFEYIPLVNKETDHVIAILISAEVPKIPINFYNLKERLKQGTTEYNEPDDKLQLTEREREVLFLLFHCRSRGEIAEILSNIYNKNISEAAIRKLIQRNLYSKFNVLNDQELRYTIRSMGFHLKIPDIMSDEFIFNVDEL